MEKTEFKAVSKLEFDAFLSSYPRKLERDVYGACEPPLVTWNDFDRAPYWPDSVVAKVAAGKYLVIYDIDAPVPDDGKRDTDQPVTDRHGRVVQEGDDIIAVWGASSVRGSPWDTDRDYYSELPNEYGTYTKYRRQKVVIRDKGTKYERWSFDDCANDLRGFDFEIIS